MNKQNIILIGMPGAGKSSVGVILAKVLGYEFIDTDLVIQHREKRLLREIIADEGNEGFLAIENEVNATLEADKSVIAPGGVPESIELVGLCTDICVISNAMLLKAFYPEVPISVDASACAGVTPQSHKNALEAMKMCQIDIVNE